MLGSIAPLVEQLGLGARRPGLVPDQLPRRWPGTWLAFVLGIMRPGRAGLGPPRRTRRSPHDEPRAGSATDATGDRPSPRPSLADLAVLAFLASLAFMALEMVAGRLVAAAPGLEHLRLDERHRRPAGRPELGNFLGGKIADFIKNEKQASWLFLAGLDPDACRPAARDTSPSGSPTMFFGGEPQSRCCSQAITLSTLELGPRTRSR